MQPSKANKGTPRDRRQAMHPTPKHVRIKLEANTQREMARDFLNRDHLYGAANSAHAAESVSRRRGWKSTLSSDPGRMSSHVTSDINGVPNKPPPPKTKSSSSLPPTSIYYPVTKSKHSVKSPRVADDYHAERRRRLTKFGKEDRRGSTLSPDDPRYKQNPLRPPAVRTAAEEPSPLSPATPTPRNAEVRGSSRRNIDVMGLFAVSPPPLPPSGNAGQDPGMLNGTPPSPANRKVTCTRFGGATSAPPRSPSQNSTARVGSPSDRLMQFKFEPQKRGSASRTRKAPQHRSSAPSSSASSTSSFSYQTATPFTPRKGGRERRTSLADFATSFHNPTGSRGAKSVYAKSVRAAGSVISMANSSVQATDPSVD